MKKNKNLKRLLLVMYMFFCSIFCFSQVSTEWLARYAGPYQDRAEALAVDALGNVYVTGQSDRAATPGIDEVDYLTIKYNRFGVQQWLARYNGPADRFDMARAIAVDASGNVYVTGRSKGTSGTGNTDYATVKYNSSGIQQWVARSEGLMKLDDNAEAIAVDASGNVYVTGWSDWTSLSSANMDYATIKYNSSGVQQWVARYNGPAGLGDYASSLVLDNSANVYVTGHSYSVGSSYDYATIKYNSAGVMQWEKRYNGPGNDIDVAEDIAVDASGNVYVTGRSTGSGTDTDYATIKYNSAGVLQWLGRYNGPGNDGDVAHAIVVDGSGNVYVTGDSDARPGSDFNNDWATIKYNAAGVRQWIRRYNGPVNGTDRAQALAHDVSGNIYVTGFHIVSDSGLSNYFTMKYDAMGNIKWQANYGSPGLSSGDAANSIIVDASGRVYVTGIGDNDYVTIKYSQATAKTAMTKTSEKLPLKFKATCYPNPASSIARIQYEVPVDGRVAIKLYDALGREIAILVDEEKNAGYHFKEFDVSQIQNGAYFYNVSLSAKQNTVTESGKMLVVK